MGEDDHTQLIEGGAFVDGVDEGMVFDVVVSIPGFVAGISVYRYRRRAEFY